MDNLWITLASHAGIVPSLYGTDLAYSVMGTLTRCVMRFACRVVRECVVECGEMYTSGQVYGSVRMCVYVWKCVQESV